MNRANLPSARATVAAVIARGHVGQPDADNMKNATDEGLQAAINVVVAKGGLNNPDLSDLKAASASLA